MITEEVLEIEYVDPAPKVVEEVIIEEVIPQVNFLIVEWSIFNRRKRTYFSFSVKRGGIQSYLPLPKP